MSGRFIIHSKPKESSGTVYICYFVILTLCQEVSTSPKHQHPQSTDQTIKYNLLMYIYFPVKRNILPIFFLLFFHYYFYSKLDFFFSWNSNRKTISLSGGYFINISICSNFRNSIQFKAYPSSCQLFLIQHCLF